MFDKNFSGIHQLTCKPISYNNKLLFTLNVCCRSNNEKRCNSIKSPKKEIQMNSLEKSHVEAPP